MLTAPSVESFWFHGFMHARCHACKPVQLTFRLNHLQVVKLAGVEAYLAKAEKPLPGAPAVVLIHDIFGWEAKNVRLYADKLAQQGACWSSAPLMVTLTVPLTGLLAWEGIQKVVGRVTRKSARELGHWSRGGKAAKCLGRR